VRNFFIAVNILINQIINDKNTLPRKPDSKISGTLISLLNKVAELSAESKINYR